MAIKTIRVFQEFTSAGYVPMPVAGNIDYGVTIANTFPATTPTTFQTDDPDIDVTLTATTDYYVWIRSNGTDWNPMYTRNVRVYPDSPLINNVVMGIIIANLNNTVPYVGATTNVDLGTYGLKADYLQLNTAPTSTPTTQGTIAWNSLDGTADLRLTNGGLSLKVGQDSLARVVNGTSSNLLKADYKVVKIIGAQGQRLQIGLALADNDYNSKDTIGLVAENINNNQEGFIITSGIIDDINTTGTLQGEIWNDGDTLYLSGTTYGKITNVKPQAPTHTIILGFVVYAHANHGKIFVKVDNGYEIDELHNVKIVGALNKDVLVYNSTTKVWENRIIFKTQGYVPFYDDTLLLNNSPLYTNGNNVAIGTTTLTEKLVVGGNVLATQFKKLGGLSTEFLKADGSSDSTAYQPLSADLTAIDALALTTGLLRKNGSDTWVLDQTEYLSVAIAGSTYQTLANLSANLTASTTKYPSVNAVNTGLALKLNLTGGTLTGGLTLNYSYPNIALSDVSSGTTWNMQNDGSTFKLNYGATNNFYIFSSGNATFVNNLTASALIKSGGTASQFLKADGSVDNTNYQPYDADLASIAGLELTTGLLRKNGLNTYTLDQTEYVSLTTANSTFQTLANLSSNLTASTTKYPSVNAVNTGLNLKLNLSGGTLTGDLALAYSYPNIQLNDTGSGTIWNIQNDSGGLEFNSGTTNKFTMFSSGNATFVNDLTANKFIKSGGTSAQYLMADGSVSSGNAGSVTSVGLSAPTGFSVTNSPITSSGTLALGFASGYSLPSDATQATWTAKQNALNGGSGFVKSTAGVISYDSATYYLASNPSGYITSSASISGSSASAPLLTSSGGLTTQYGNGTIGYASAIAYTTTGLFPAGDNSNSILTLNRHPDNYYSQLGFSSNGNMYYRSFSATAINTTTPWRTIWDSGTLTNLNQLTNGPGYITGYTETDTLATVTGRGATTSTETTYFGGLRTRKSQTAGDYSTAALWTESYNSTATGIAFHISGIKGTFLEMRTNQILYWDGNTVYHSGNLTNLNQLTNGPGYITASSLSSYLPLAGGTLSGQLIAPSVKLSTSTNNALLTGASDWGVRFSNDSGYIQVGPANSSYAHIYTDRAQFYFNKDILINNVQAVVNSGTWGINITGNANTATTATNQSGGTVNATTGIFTPNSSGVSTGLNVVNGDITTYRSGGTTGVIYFNSAGTRYLYYDGTNYAMPGGNLYVNSALVLTNSNYNSYSPQLNGTGATGTWAINISGNAATASSATSAGSTTYLASLGNYVWSASTLPTGFNQGIQSSFVSASQGFQSFGSVMTMNTYNGGGGALQLFVPYSPTYGGVALQARFGNYDVSTGNSWTAWKTLLQSDNYNSYAPTLTGGGASGTWGISVSGSAGSVAWTNVSGRPTAVSSFTNDSGYVVGGSSPTFTEVYANNWFRNNGVNEGLYNESTTQHWSSGANGWWDASSTTSFSGIRMYTGGHLGTLRGSFYADNNNWIGILSNDQNWALRIDSSKNAQVYGDLTVGNGTNSNIYMVDTDENTRRIHTNSGRIGFLTTSNGWGLYCDNAGLAYANGGNRLVENTGTWSISISGNAATAYNWANTPDSWYGVGQSTSASGATAIGGYYPWTLSYHTGLALSAHSSYGGIRFYNQNYPSGPLASAPTMQIVNNDVLINGYSAVNSQRTLTINGTTYDLSANRSWTVSTSGGIAGSGTTGTLARWDSGSSLNSSIIYDNGSTVTIGNSVSMYKLSVNPISNSIFGIGYTGTNQIFVNAVDTGFTAIPIVYNALSHTWLIGFGTAMTLTSSLDLLIGTSTGVSGGGKLQVNGDVNINGSFKINGTVIGGGGGSGISGSGTANMIPKWTGGTSLSDSAIYDNGAFSIGIGTTSVSLPSGRSGLVVRTSSFGGSAEILIQQSSNANGTSDGFAIANIYNDGAAIYNRANLHLRFGTNNIERMRLTEDGNLGFGYNAGFGAGVKVIGIGNATTVPTTNPSNAGILWVENGALRYRGSNGTVTTIAIA